MATTSSAVMHSVVSSSSSISVRSVLVLDDFEVRAEAPKARREQPAAMAATVAAVDEADGMVLMMCILLDGRRIGEDSAAKLS